MFNETGAQQPLSQPLPPLPPSSFPPPPPPPRRPILPSSPSTSVSTSVEIKTDSNYSPSLPTHLIPPPPPPRTSILSASTPESESIAMGAEDTKTVASSSDVELVVTASSTAPMASSTSSSIDEKQLSSLSQEQKFSLGPEPVVDSSNPEKNRVEYITWMLQGGWVLNLRKQGKEQEAADVTQFIQQCLPFISEDDVRFFFNRNNLVKRLSWKRLLPKPGYHEGVNAIRSAAAKETGLNVGSNTWQWISNILTVVLLGQSIGCSPDLSLAEQLTDPRNLPLLISAVVAPFVFGGAWAGYRAYRIPVNSEDAKSLEEKLAKYQRNLTDDLLLLGKSAPIGKASQTLRFNGLLGEKQRRSLTQHFIEATQQSGLFSKQEAIETWQYVVDQFDRDPDLMTLYQTDPYTYLDKCFIPAFCCWLELKKQAKKEGISELWFNYRAQAALVSLGEHASYSGYAKWMIKQAWFLYTSYQLGQLFVKGMIHLYQKTKFKNDCEGLGEEFKVAPVSGRNRCLACSSEPMISPSDQIVYPSDVTGIRGRQQCLDAFSQYPHDMTQDFVPFLSRIPNSLPIMKLDFSQQDGSVDWSSFFNLVRARPELFSSLQTLYVNMTGIKALSSDNAYQLFSLIAEGHFPNLEDFDISNQAKMGLNETVFTQSVQAFHQLRHLKRVGIKSNFVNGPKMATLTTELAQSPQMEELALDGNNMDVSGGQAVASLIPHTPSLTRLTMSRDFIKCGGFAFLSPALQNSSITYLDLSSNSLTASCALEGQAAVANMPIQTLVLNNNFAMGPQWMNLTSETLTELDVVAVNMGKQGAQILGQSLKNSLPHVKILQAGSNNIGNEGLEAIANGLSSTANEVYVDANGIDGEGLTQKVCEQLSAKPSLTSVDLHGNSLGPGGIANLTKVLPSSSVTHVNFDNTHIGQEDLAQIFKCSNLEQLYLGNNEFGNITEATAKAYCSPLNRRALLDLGSDLPALWASIIRFPECGLYWLQDLSLLSRPLSSEERRILWQLIGRGAPNLDSLLLGHVGLSQDDINQLARWILEGATSPSKISVTANENVTTVGPIFNALIHSEECLNKQAFVSDQSSVATSVLARTSTVGEKSYTIDMRNTGADCAQQREIICPYQGLPVKVQLNDGSKPCGCPSTSAASRAEPLFIFMWMGWLFKSAPELLALPLSHLSRFVQSVMGSLPSGETLLLPATASASGINSNQNSASTEDLDVQQLFILTTLGLVLVSPRTEQYALRGFRYVKNVASNVVTNLSAQSDQPDEEASWIETVGQMSQQMVLMGAANSYVSKGYIDLNNIAYPLVGLGLAILHKAGVLHVAGKCVSDSVNYVCGRATNVRKAVSTKVDSTASSCYQRASSWAFGWVSYIADSTATAVDAVINQAFIKSGMCRGPMSNSSYTP